MRVDGLSPQSYPIKRKPRKGAARVEETGEDIEGVFEARDEPVVRPRTGGSGNVSGLPARRAELLYEMGMSRSAANALASYLTTAGFGDWEHEVLGLDLHI